MMVEAFKVIPMMAYQSGGVGGIFASMFSIGGIDRLLREGASLEVALLMLVCLLAFVFIFQMGRKSRERRYNFEKYARVSRYDDPTIDYDAKRSINGLDDRSELRAANTVYTPKDSSGQFNNIGRE